MHAKEHRLLPWLAQTLRAQISAHRHMEPPGRAGANAERASAGGAAARKPRTWSLHM